jgi:hypothetical protein
MDAKTRDKKGETYCPIIRDSELEREREREREREGGRERGREG